MTSQQKIRILEAQALYLAKTVVEFLYAPRGRRAGLISRLLFDPRGPAPMVP